MSEFKKYLQGEQSLVTKFRDGEFDRKMFHALTRDVVRIHSSQISRLERLGHAVVLWEIGFHFQNQINYFGLSTKSEFCNITLDEIRQLSEIFFYMCNWFTYNKEIDHEYLRFGKW
ncbi:MAG: hypothetical protein DRI69_06945 [Bacteroidetes bacterium]|nr:MAG: hypothetical protein DRI69_06945 [Bacteroidota bacterium]